MTINIKIIILILSNLFWRLYFFFLKNHKNAC